MKYILWAGILLAIALIVDSIIRKAKQRRSETAGAGDTSGLFGPSAARALAAQQARDLKFALHQGIIANEWHPWGEDTEALYRIAGEIKNFGDVSKEYRIIYDRDLLKDLQFKLAPDEYAKFSELVGR